MKTNDDIIKELKEKKQFDIFVKFMKMPEYILLRIAEKYKYSLYGYYIEFIKKCFRYRSY